jgi:ribosomal protein S18 acetylase RimI-like enzyme
VNPLDERVWTAHGDAWQAEGRLRQPFGGGAAELPGTRLMASGLQHPEWNNADVTDPAFVSVEHVRAWYAERAHGAGVPWGVRVPAGRRFPHGRHLFRKRCMALLPGQMRPRAGVDGVEIRTASAADAGSVARIDAAAFQEPIEKVRPWVEPHLGASGFVVALAELDGEPAGVATSIVTDGRAGHCVGIFGVAVLPGARRRGMAAAMVCWLLQRAFSEGAAFAHLNPNTDPAARLYAGLGFEETAGLDVYVDL